MELIRVYFTKGNRGGIEGGEEGREGGESLDIKDTRSLVSERERYQREVDETLEVARDIEREFGVVIEDLLVAKIGGRKGGGVLGYYDGSGNIGINEKYWKKAGKELDDIYDGTVSRGYHPSRGKKSGLQAVVAHELGHRVNYIAGGSDWGNLDKTAYDIVVKASARAGYKNRVREFRNAISGYGNYNNAEAVAEAFADVYCNKRKASKESRAVVAELKKYFRKKR